jgi:hypothetical protein
MNSARHYPDAGIRADHPDLRPTQIMLHASLGVQNSGSVIVLPACGGYSALWPDLWLIGEGRACTDALIPELGWKSW